MITSFRGRELPAGRQARLEAILATADDDYPQASPGLAGETLSAISPPAAMLHQDR
ncbi:MAG: hypothetical protein HC871_10355 [Rhizobiales bacterium]|nr:hypothetical protein [Hyphomicrobiales bacterium]